MHLLGATDTHLSIILGDAVAAATEGRGWFTENDCHLLNEVGGLDNTYAAATSTIDEVLTVAVATRLRLAPDERPTLDELPHPVNVAAGLVEIPSNLRLYDMPFARIENGVVVTADLKRVAKAAFDSIHAMFDDYYDEALNAQMRKESCQQAILVIDYIISLLLLSISTIEIAQYEYLSARLGR